jgi:hypothetical protein
MKQDPRLDAGHGIFPVILIGNELFGEMSMTTGVRAR